MEKEFTFLDIVKGILFCVGLLAGIFVVIFVIGAIFFDYLPKIENPVILILAISGFLVLFVFVIAFSKIKQAGYQKNIFTELYKIIKGKSKG